MNYHLYTGDPEELNWRKKNPGKNFPGYPGYEYYHSEKGPDGIPHLVYGHTAGTGQYSDNPMMSMFASKGGGAGGGKNDSMSKMLSEKGS